MRLPTEQPERSRSLSTGRGKHTATGRRDFIDLGCIRENTALSRVCTFARPFSDITSKSLVCCESDVTKRTGASLGAVFCEWRPLLPSCQRDMVMRAGMIITVLSLTSCQATPDSGW